MAALINAYAELANHSRVDLDVPYRESIINVA